VAASPAVASASAVASVAGAAVTRTRVTVPVTRGEHPRVSTIRTLRCAHRSRAAVLAARVRVNQHPSEENRGANDQSQNGHVHLRMYYADLMLRLGYGRNLLARSVLHSG